MMMVTVVPGRAMVPAGGLVRRGRPVADPLTAASNPALVLPLPDLTNLSLDEARALISAGGWKLGPLTERRQDDTFKGQVLASSPTAGARVGLGDTVDLTVSAGQKIYPIPLDALNDVTVEDATAALAEVGFAIDSSGQAYHEDVEQGRVIGAVPGTSERAERGNTEMT